uniref:Uncharacterized protein n=1 Tax=Steinernema glaseri TaxID=37863 RepID=A0A1I7ZPG6_9BILA
ELKRTRFSLCHNHLRITPLALPSTSITIYGPQRTSVHRSLSQ